MLRIAAVALCLCFASNCLAAVVSMHSYESNTAGDNFPSEMTFTGAFGDADSTFFRVDNTAPRTGSLHYVADMGNNGGGSGFGGTFSALSLPAQAGTLTSTSTFEVSAWFRQSSTDPWTGNGEVNVHFEFFDASSTLIFRTDSANLHAKFNQPQITNSYQQLTHTYSLGNAGQIPNPAAVDRVAALVTTTNGGNTADGTIFVDDFLFVTAPVPEPSALSGVLMFGLLCRMRRRRSA